MRRQRILIVEDDGDLRRMFRQMLSLGGYEVLEAGDGLNALRAIEVAALDAVILDLGLPVLSGYVVRQELAADAHTRQVPVIVVTGESVDHDRLDAACVLRKPVSPERLLHVVRTCIASGGATTAAC